MLRNLVTYHVHRHQPLPKSDVLGYQYLLGAGGLFVRAENAFFSACIPVSHCCVRGLQPIPTRFQLKIPRLNGRLLTAVIQDARRQRTKEDQLCEVLYQFRQQPNGAVQVIKPKQRTTPISIASWPTSDRRMLCDLHSHGTIPAYFSSTDDKDEQGLRLYAVIGNLLRHPEICLRIGVYGYWQPLPLTAVFTHAGPFADLYKSKEQNLSGGQG